MKLSIQEFLVKLWIVYLFFNVLSIEVLSKFNIVNRESIIIYQIIFTFGLFMFIKVENIKITFSAFKNITKFNLIVIVLSLLMIIIPLFLIAVSYPPNNWDSMTYHMARVMHWKQNKNVAFYPTNNDRQLYSGPVAEYVILNWMLLINSDLLSNLVQYLSMLGSVVASTLIVKMYSKDRLAQLLAGVLMITIPMGIMQSTTTQNDFVTALFLICFIYFGLKIAKAKSSLRLNSDIIFFSITFALGMLTKNTFIIFAAPFAAYFIYKIYITKRKELIKLSLTVVTIYLLVNIPQLYRNSLYYGSPFGQTETVNLLKNQSPDLKYVLSNLIRNTAMNLGLPNQKYNNAVDNAVYMLHKSLGISSNDPVNTFLSIKYKTLSLVHEDVAGNFIMILLFFVAGVIVFIGKRTKSFRPYYYCLMAGWLLFSIVLKWQPWGTRLQLPFFVALSPALSIVIFNYFKKKYLVFLIIITLLILSRPWILGSSGRPLRKDLLTVKINRLENYYNMNGVLYKEHQDIANLVKKSRETNIALDIGGDSYEYPLWVMLKDVNPMINLQYIRQPKGAGGRNFNDNFKYKIIIYDDPATEKYFNDKEIAVKSNLGGVGYIVLKNQSNKIISY